MFTKFKSFVVSDKGFYATLVLLVGILAYGLGMQSVELSSLTNESQPAIVFTAAPDAVVPADAIPVVASRSGTKYHREDCSSAATIKDSNLIRFESIDLARAAGYLPASNCPGL